MSTLTQKQSQNGVGVAADKPRRGGGSQKSSQVQTERKIVAMLGRYRVYSDGDNYYMANAPETRALALLLGYPVKASRKEICLPVPDPSAIADLAKVLHKMHRPNTGQIDQGVYAYLAELGINDPVRSALAADAWVTVDKVYAHYTRMKELMPIDKSTGLRAEPSRGLLINVLRQHQEPPKNKFGGEITKPNLEMES